jgi:hypothetical protein
MKNRVGDSRAHVNVMEADAPDEAEELRQTLEEELNCQNYSSASSAQ